MVVLKKGSKNKKPIPPIRGQIKRHIFWTISERKPAREMDSILQAFSILSHLERI
ncbi:hypothetical protein OIU77_003479 [Salix suchowensis]|uniref:Uncharacterized protein n=1 Tax=Salix suchowensis TaxID=1278906 RepID=A0ABQ9AZU7_9ROSI|nr:hypothetical protein OIU77_003479 [Salix suchowensis]